MSEWKKVKLGEIAITIQTGPFGSQLHQSDYSEFGTPVVMPKDIVNGKIDVSTIARVESYHIERLSRYKITEGDILYARRGDVGKCVYIEDYQEGWLCGTGCLRVKIDIAKALPKFVFFWLQKKEIIGWIEKHAIGATMLNLNTSILSNVPIDLPPIETQNRIATILSRYDSLIENYQKQIKLLEEFAQRLYKEWFIDFRFPGHENAKIVDGIPEGWEKKKIKDLVDLKSGYAFKSSTFVEKGEYKIVTIKNVKDGSFDGENVSFLNFVPEKIPSHCFLHTGDILLSLTGNVGRVCMVVGDYYLLNQRVAKLESNFPAFTYCLFRFYDTFVAINNLANGAAQQNVSPIRIGDLNIIIANDDIMHRFENVAENIRINILNLSLQIRYLTEARDRLLLKLMSGEKYFN